MVLFFPSLSGVTAELGGGVEMNDWAPGEPVLIFQKFPHFRPVDEHFVGMTLRTCPFKVVTDGIRVHIKRKPGFIVAICLVAVIAAIGRHFDTAFRGLVGVGMYGPHTS